MLDVESLLKYIENGTSYAEKYWGIRKYSVKLAA